MRKESAYIWPVLNISVYTLIGLSSFVFNFLLSNQEEVSIHLMCNQVPHLNDFKYIFEHIASHPVFSVPIKKGNMFGKFLIYP